MSPAPASVTTVGSMRVERYGSGSPALIFVPGLACGSWVWKSAVARYAPAHAVYLVTLAGFDGVPPVAGNAIDSADASLLTLIQTEKLDRPVLIGHSLGGHLALRFGAEHAALLRGVVSVDGTPVFPTLTTADAADRATQADAFADGIRNASPAAYATTNRATIGSMLEGRTDADAVAAKTGAQAQSVVADYAAELLRADIRPLLPSLTIPALVLAPVPAEPASFEGPLAASATIDQRAPFYQSFYQSLFTGAPHLSVEMVLNSRHFAMIDQPGTTYGDISNFIASLK